MNARKLSDLLIDLSIMENLTVFMRSYVCLFAGALMLLGCAGQKPANSPFDAPPVVTKNPHDKFIITPQAMVIGKVVRVNSQERFAVINFPIGRLPAMGQPLNVYRQGLKVGELKVTGPQQDDNVVADIVHGEVQTGDELRGP